MTQDKAQSEAPSVVDEILVELVQVFAYIWDDVDAKWWGHDTNLGNQALAFEKAKAKINRLVDEERKKSLGLADYDGRFDLLTREQQEILLSYHKRSVKELEKLLPVVSNNLSKGDE